MDIELKTALDAHGAAIDAAIKKYEGQLAEQGNATAEAKAEVKALAQKFEDAIKDIGQKMESADKGEPATLSAAQEFVKSDEFKELAAGRSKQARIEVKNTVLADSNSTFPVQRPGVIPGNFLPLTLRQVIPTIPVVGNMVNALREASWTNDAAETAQGAAKPESDITFAPYNVAIETVAHWIKISKQLLADSPAIVAYIEGRLRDGLAQRVDRQILLGNGTTPNLSGLTDAGNFTAFTAGTGATLVESINKAKYQLWAVGHAPDTVVVNPADWGAMEVMREGAGTGAYLYGAPGTAGSMSPFGVTVVLSNHMPAGFFLVGNLRNSTALYQREGAVIEMGFVNDDFTKNLITIRAEERLGLGVDIPSAILYGDFSA